MAKHIFGTAGFVIFLLSFAACCHGEISIEYDDYNEWGSDQSERLLELGDSNFTWSGELELRAGESIAADILGSNPIANPLVRLSNAIKSIKNIPQDKEFEIQQHFIVSRGKDVLVGKNHTVKDRVDKFKSVTWREEFSPCSASFFQRPIDNIDFMTVLKSNENLTAELSISVELFDVSILQDVEILVPNMKTQYLSYTPINSSAKYDLMLSFLSYLNGTTVAEVFDKILIGCGSDQVDVSLTGATAGTYSVLVAGLQGSTVITLVALEGFISPDFGLVLRQRPNTDNGDSGWKTWQIILIAVGGAVVVLAALVAIGVAVVYLRRGHDYGRIN